MATKQELAEQGKQNNTQLSVAGQVNDKFITGLITQVKQKQELGLTFPSDYNPANELTGAYLILKETNDRNGKPVLDTCTPASVATALMSMVNKRLSMLKGQCYPIAYGGKLQCQPSVYGNVANARRYGMSDINATPIYEGDEFVFHKEDGKIIIDKHTTSFENIDINKIKGAYAVALMEDGSKKVEIMTISQIKAAWSQGFGYNESRNGTHQKFTDQMCEKTVKNRLIKHIIRTHGEPDVIKEYEKDEKFESVDVIVEDVVYEIDNNANATDFSEVEAEVVADAEVVSETKLPDFMSQE